MCSDTGARLQIASDPTEEEVQTVRDRLAAESNAKTGGRFDQEVPEFTCDLAVRAPDGSIAGGVTISTLLGVMWLEVLWVAPEHRRRGLASWLVLEIERIAADHGCVGGGTWTFSWQGPEFYPTIGYRLNGIYNGYPLGMTEHVLSKPLPDPASYARIADTVRRSRQDGYVLVQDPTKDEMRGVHRGLHEHCVKHAGDEMHNPGIEVKLVLRDGIGRVAGGLIASTTIRIVALERLWVDSAYRGKGYGQTLVERAEQVAKQHGCVAVQGTCFSFQGPEFFYKQAYESFGSVDVYPDDYTEHLLIKSL